MRSTVSAIRDAAVAADDLFSLIHVGVPEFINPYSIPFEDGGAIEIHMESSDSPGSASDCRLRLNPGSVEVAGLARENWILSLITHELFHAIQYRYCCGVGECGVEATIGFGDWIIEATAAAMQDRILTELDDEIGSVGFYFSANSTNESGISALQTPESSMFA